MLLNKIDKKLQTQGNWFEVDYQEEHEYPHPIEITLESASDQK